MRIVVVGAGAVGRVYGHHLALGGAEVSVFVRPTRRAEAQAGYTLTRVSLFGQRATGTFRPERVFVSAAELAGQRIDQLWLCLPTTALDDALLGDLARVLPEATFVVLAPGHFVRARVDPIVGAERTVFGLIGMVSYFAPLAGSDDPRERTTPAGIAYFLSTTKLGGKNERRGLSAVSALRSGGCPTEYQPTVLEESTISTAALMPAMASLEAAGWSLAELRQPERTELCARAMRESLAIASRTTSQPSPAYAPLVHGALIGALAWLAPRFAPLDVESFLRVHFSKVAAQTDLLLETSVEEGQRFGMPTDALTELLSLLSEARSEATAATATKHDTEPQAS